MSDKKFYVTTPIYYVNARPHIGHAYTTIVADVLARRHRLLGEDTFFLTGTDEHGQKIERSAAAAGIPPQQFADQVSKSFEDLWHRMGITNDAYIRTTDPQHKRGVQHLFSELYARGFIYLASYTGSYCVSDETFVDAPVGTPCPDCGRLLEEVTEENFFFKLSAFQRPLLDLIESDTITITPDSRKNEVLSFLRGNLSKATEDAVIQSDARSEKNAVILSEVPSEKNADILSEGRSEKNAVILSGGRSPKSKDPDAAAPATTANPFPTTNLGTPYNHGALKDLSISRSSFTWGIPVPEPAASAAAQNHVIYVWLDALANYMTAIGYGSDDPAEQSKFQKFWPADLHLVGKEIIRFHCVYWPAFLLALNPAYNPDAVILSEGRSPQPKDPDAPSPATTASTISTPEAPAQLTFDQHKRWAAKMLPQAITAHGWLLFDDSKMSKSKGNIVRTETILDAFGTLCPPPPPSLSSTPLGLSSPPSALSSPPSALSSPPSALSSPPSALSSPPSGLSSPPSGLSSFAEGGGPASPAPPTPSPEVDDRRGTASAVPDSPSTKDGALAPEVRLPTKADRDLFASDVLRYFLLREIPFGQDGSFSFDALITRYNADLANGYGNLVSRTLTMISKYCDEIIPDQGKRSKQSRHVASLTDGDIVTHVWQGAALGAFPMDYNVVDNQGNSKKAEQRNVMLADMFAELLQKRQFNRALELLMEGVRSSDLDMSFTKPWALAKTEEADAKEELSSFLGWHYLAIREITALLYPILPYATARVWAQLGLGSIQQAAAEGKLKNLQWGGLQPGTKLGPLSPIFPRADKGLAQMMIGMETLPSLTTENEQRLTETEELLADTQPPATLSTDPAAPPRPIATTEPGGPLPVAGSTAHTAGPDHAPSHANTVPSAPFNTVASQTPITASSTDASPQITIDDFVKIELRVAQILVAERIPKADKLLRLEVDLGPHGKRQILSGIAEWYTPEDLIGRRIVVITNLAPRKMRGLESHGMLLAASNGENGKPVLATFGEDIALGSRLK